MLLSPDPCFLFVRAIGLLLGLRGPHALLKDVSEVKVEVKLQIFWFLLQPCVFLLLPRSSFKDKGIEAKDAHHLLHVLRRMGRAQRGASSGGWGLYAVTNERSGGLDYESVDGL